MIPDHQSIDDNIQKRILDAARDLLLHYGYDKTTINDIADRAHVSKSTVYLRWNRKEDLFQTLFWQEELTFLDEWQKRINDDLHGGLFPELYVHALGILLENEFMAAFYRRDRRIFGGMIQSLASQQLYPQRQQELLLMLFQQLQEAGIVRSEIEARTLVLILHSLNYGLVQTVPMIGGQTTLDMGAALVMVTTMMQPFAAPDGAADSERGKVVIRDFVTRFRQEMK